MPRQGEFLEEVAQVVEKLPTSAGKGAKFVRHKGHTAFRDSPASTGNGFAVGIKSSETTNAFGRESQKQSEVFFEVEIGHAPIGPNDEREAYLAEDLERVVDELEAKEDWSAGSGGAVDLVQVDVRGTPDRTNALWWVTPLTFRALVWGPIWRG